MTSVRPPGLTRRTVLRRVAATAAALTVPGALVGCGDEAGPGPQERAVTARSIGVDYASYYAPVAALRRLITARAQAVGALPTFSDDAAGSAAQQANLRRWLDPDDGFDAVVVSAFDPAAIREQVAAATKAGIHVVSYVAPLPGATAAIEVDPAEAAALLVRHLTAWEDRAGARGNDVVLVRPTPDAPIPEPLTALAAPTMRALEQRLASAGSRVVAVVPALAAADAEAAVARAVRQTGADVALCWNDTTAVGAAKALRGGHLPAERGRLYAGAVALGGPTSDATLRALSQDGPLRCIVAPSLRDLAAAAVDLPFGMLRGKPPADVRIPVSPLTPGASSTRRARMDLRTS
jgi:ABC-type sugar transport system substrate-binding protein